MADISLGAKLVSQVYEYVSFGRKGCRIHRDQFINTAICRFYIYYLRLFETVGFVRSNKSSEFSSIIITRDRNYGSYIWQFMNLTSFQIFIMLSKISPLNFTLKMFTYTLKIFQSLSDSKIRTNGIFEKKIGHASR